jgi:hypothetical protein
MREGRMRAKLREAILAGFNSTSLDELLRDHDMLRPNIALGPDFKTRVSSLIDVARQEGWLADLCGVLAAARERNVPVHAAIVAVEKWLTEQHDTGEVERQFQSPDPNGGLKSVRMLAVLIAAVALAGFAALMFAPRSSITTTGTQSPIFQGHKGDLNINFGTPPPAPK